MAAEDDIGVDLVFSDEGDETETNAEELSELFSGEEDEESFTYNEDEANLVAAFEASEEGKKELRKIATKVKKDFDDARDSSEEYRERMASDWKLFAGELDKKEWPFANCANAHVPIMLENISRLTMRMSSELFGDGSNFFSVIPGGPEDDEIARILTTHGNWQFNEQIDDFYRQQERGLLAFTAWGDVSFHSFYDFARQENRHEVLTPDQLYVPYVFTTTRVDYSDVPYLVKVLLLYRHDLQAMRDQWEHVDDVLEKESPSWDDDPDTVIADSVSETTSIVKDSDARAPYKLLQYEGWLELPEQSRDRYCQVILDCDTMHVLKLTIHEEVDWRDRERYNQQQAEFDQYIQARGAYDAQFDAAKEQEDSTREAIGMSMAVPGEMKGQFIDEAAAPRMMMEAPQTPEWLTDEGMQGPEELKKVPIRMFSHGVCIENMNGSLGLSFGRVQADFNRAANTALSQFIDAATLGNISSWIATDAFDPKGKSEGMEMKPGKINYITGTSGDDIRKSLMQIETKPANPQMLETVDKMYGYGQSSIQAPSVLSGESGKSGETYRGISARIEQATKQLSVSTRKYARLLNNVIRNNARLNAMFLPDNELVQMTDHELGRQVAATIGRKMYERNYRIRFTSDLKFSSQAQRISEADELLQLPQACPPLQQNMAYLWEATKGALVARSRPDLVQRLGPRPPDPQTPFGLPPPAPPAPPGPPGASSPAPEGGPGPGPQGSV